MLSFNEYFGFQPVLFSNLLTSGICKVTSTGLNSLGSCSLGIFTFAFDNNISKNSPTVTDFSTPILYSSP